GSGRESCLTSTSISCVATWRTRATTFSTRRASRRTYSAANKRQIVGWAQGGFGRPATLKYPESSHPSAGVEAVPERVVWLAFQSATGRYSDRPAYIHWRSVWRAHCRTTDSHGAAGGTRSKDRLRNKSFLHLRDASR